MLPLFPQKKNTSIDKSKPQVILVTKDFSGLGWAEICVKNGYSTLLAIKTEEATEYDKLSQKAELTVEELARVSELEDILEKIDLVGDGMMDKILLDDLMAKREKFRDAFWIWDGNHNYKEGELLRKEGFRNIFGGTELTYKMENDRNFGVSIAEKAGLPTPDTHEFSSIDEGLAFLEQNTDKAYVFKPDDGEGAYATYVPDSIKDEEAHQELVVYMQSLPDEGGTYILQERIKGVEINFEAWIYKGTPFFAFGCLESKRRSNRDKGELVGCAHDIAFTIPLQCKGMRETVLKLLPHLPKDYTGFLDINFIHKDKQDYFLEFCARFGYNSHPNLFINLGIKSFPEIMIDFINGNIRNFYKNFRDGFGASILCRITHPKKGFPFYLRESADKNFFFFDEYCESDQYFLSGYSNEVGIICGHDYTIKTAGEECLNNFEKVNYPLHDGRTDIDKNDYPSSPQARHDALEAFGYLDVTE